MRWHDGDVVAFWNESALDLAVAAGEEKQRVRLILPDGRETRVPHGRLAFVVAPSAGPPSEGAAAIAAAAAKRVRARAETVDVALVWELAVAEDPPPDLGTLAVLALGSASGEACAALVTAFLRDGIRFSRRGDRWEARDGDAVRGLVHEREVSARREGERERARSALARAADGARESPDGNPVLRRYLQALEEVAVFDLDASDAGRQLATEALRASGLAFERPAEGAFRLLRRFGRWADDDANLQVERYGFRTGFPAEVLARVERIEPGRFHRDERTDLTALDVFAIDSARTREVDDGISVEARASGGMSLGVHIADPAAFVAVGDPIDVEAASRGATVYFPDGKLNMLPPRLSEDLASLTVGRERPALSFLLEVDADGAIAGSRIVRTVIRVRERFAYADLDRRLREDASAPEIRPIADLDRIARAMEKRRTDGGALILRADDSEVHVGSDGEPVIERLDADSSSRRIVTEAMIAAGAAAATWAVRHGVPLVFRRQPRPPNGEVLAGRIILDRPELRRARSVLRRGEATLEPGEHFALGLATYAQVTSPLRRYQDLANHRQIIAALSGREPPYDGGRLATIAAKTERVEIDGRRAERRADRYWRLRALGARVGATVTGIVVDVTRRPVVELPEFGLEETVAGVEGVEEGRTIAVRVAHVNPRADLARLRPER